mmetsp:Transcript_219/g.315  ORF Transcript_219/g.315 Transcript_219/m.315 type:complete len:278 (-) Transcript_219:925-1758(-)
MMVAQYYQYYYYTVLAHNTDTTPLRLDMDCSIRRCFFFSHHHHQWPADLRKHLHHCYSAITAFFGLCDDYNCLLEKKKKKKSPSPHQLATPARESSRRRKGGSAARHTAKLPFRAMASAEKGKASFSVCASAAVPRPCPEMPMASPRATGSRTRNRSIRICPKFCPRMPVRMIMATATEAFAPPSISKSGRPSAMVTLRMTVLVRRPAARPRARARTAVPSSEKAAENRFVPTTTARFWAMSARRWYMLRPKLRMEGPSRPRSTSPAPMPRPPCLRV